MKAPYLPPASREYIAFNARTGLYFVRGPVAGFHGSRADAAKLDPVESALVAVTYANTVRVPDGRFTVWALALRLIRARVLSRTVAVETVAAIVAGRAAR